MQNTSPPLGTRYDPSDHYWIVAGGDIWSSKRKIVVTSDDTAYKAFVEDGGFVGKVASYGELYDRLAGVEGSVTGVAPDIARETGAVWVSENHLSPQQAATVMLAIGIEIASTSDASRNGHYAIDLATRQRAEVIANYATRNNKFPGNSDTVAWPDISGTPHNFTVTAFTALANAMADYVAELDIAQSTNTTVTPGVVTIA